tara:strand:+ start:3303 stop:3761 length:459 start_codon:yes stop_codon:yes gene_type:complete
MKKIIPYPIVILILLISSNSGYAEYRAYELEVFDHITKTSRKIITSFSPSDFIQVNGGPYRIGIIIRASWICYGDTSLNKKVCPIPKPINPRFQEGDRVQIILRKHLTDKWTGIIENSFFRPELRSNVYGVRFPKRGNIYTRYYESNLKKSP